MAIANISGFPHTYELTPPTDSSTALVFIHGWLLSRHYWRPLIEALKVDYQCLAYDLRGFGDSRFPSDVDGRHGQAWVTQPEQQVTPFAPVAYASDLAMLVQQLGISRAWLIGHSLGGAIALWAAAQAPACIEGVICINAGGGVYIREEFERFRSAGQQLVKFRPRWLRYVPMIDVLFARMAVKQPLPYSWGRQRVIDLIAAEAEAAVGTLLDSTTEVEVHYLPQLVSQLQQPAYFIAGAQDPIMAPKYVRHLASFHALSGEKTGNVIEIENCGHFAMLEQPSLTTASIRTILYRHGV